MQDTVDESATFSSFRQGPADLVVVGLVVALVIVTTFPVIEDSLFATAVRAVFVGFVPGYALIAALFPSADTDTDTAETAHTRRGGSDGRITRLERFALSIAASGGLLGAVAGGLVATSVTGGTTAAIRILALVTAALLIVAVIRRMALSPSERFGRPATVWVDLLNPFGSGRSGGDLLSTVAFGFVVLLVISSAAYAMVPVQEEGYTELYLLHEEDGDPVSEEYPTELTAGQQQPLIVGIGNQEGTATTYTVVVQLQEVETEGSQLTVQSATELDRFELSLEDGETVETEHVVSPDQSGQNLRLTYLLYVGDPPESPSEENAYRSTYVWVDVTESGG